MEKAAAVITAFLVIFSLAACAPGGASGNSETAAPSGAVQAENPPAAAALESTGEAAETPDAAFPLEIDAPYLPLYPTPDLGNYPQLPPHMLELGDTLILRYVRDGEWETRSTFEAFSLTDGKSLYSFDVEGVVARLEPCGDIDGFDYRIFKRNSVLYKNSGDPAAEKEVFLPETVNPAAEPDLLQLGAFDLKFGKLVWMGDEGVYLANADGSDAKLIMPNQKAQMAVESQLSKKAVIPSEPSIFIGPRLLCGGTRVAAIIYAPEGQGQDYASGIGIYREDWGVTNTYMGLYGVNIGPHMEILEDRTVAVTNWDATALIDADTGEASDLPYKADHANYFYTADFETFVTQPADPDGNPESDRKQWTLYLCEKDPADRSRPLTTVALEGEASFYIPGVTENHVVIACAGEKPVYAAVKYR